LNWDIDKSERAFHAARASPRPLAARNSDHHELADDHAHTYAGYIRAAVREVGQNYRQVANWLTRERIPTQRNGRWTAQSVKNLVNRYERLTGKQLLVPYKAFPTPAKRKDAPSQVPLVPWEDRGGGRRVRVRTKGFYWLY
jgi:Recombinase